MLAHRFAAAAAFSLIAAIIFSTPFSTVSAQAPSPAPFLSPEPLKPLGPLAPTPATTTNDCITPLLNMSDCLSYVQEPSTAKVPDKNCCPELAGLVDSNPICLCQLLGNSSLTESFGIKININRALKLPSVCGVETPPVSTCAAVGYPVPGPTASAPGVQPPEGIAGIPSAGNNDNRATNIPGVQPPEGIASIPSVGNNDNGATKIAGSAKEFLIGLAFSFLLTFF
ncbi:hypothetical protein JCGZ_23849 [Jatropha curcas]|uniref:Bifunctional inhibitor/plant lipid transfer protein/seed storage helical domain-containing protein n=1 Tax=Jatropha curcas TaxID=180498 RepID=A0A067L3B0_JATCU|nr:xylogen-like protein 11 [Jatropha curcas]KDP42907.1 hypothetical protein JCGZ_23849 [Jatropha curcas]